MFDIKHRLTERCIQDNFFKSEKEKEGWTRKDREDNVYISVRQMKSFILLSAGWPEDSLRRWQYEILIARKNQPCEDQEEQHSKAREQLWPRTYAKTSLASSRSHRRARVA